MNAHSSQLKHSKHNSIQISSSASTTATMSSSSAASRHYQLSVAVPFKASRDDMWKGLVDKIRAPEKYVGSRNVKILEDTPTYVRRYMEAGPEAAPMTIKEKITWDEKAGLVTFTSEDNPNMSGSVLNQIETAADGSLQLRFSFDWQFSEKAPDAMVAGTTKMLTEENVRGIIQKTIGVVEGTSQ